MKKLLLILSFCFILGTIYGQIPNSSFEGWSSTAYDEPTGFQTGNHESVSLGLTPITRVNGTSGYAVRMETLVNNGDTAQAYIANGDPMQGMGGIPFAEQATAISGFYRYGVTGNDSALILIMFKKNGSIISSDVFKIHGTQNTFTSFSFPLTLAMIPDSVIIAATSSNLIDNVGVTGGSWMELDAISFTGTSTPVDNGNFENWTTNSNDAINGWETYGEGFARTTDSYDGTYAVSLTTVDYGNGNIGTSGMTTGHMTQNGPAVGGFPFTSTVDTLIGYYKFITSGTDSGSISISLTNNMVNVWGTGRNLPPVSQYTYFEIPISAWSTPDTMRIDITSSKWPYDQNSVGSTLYIDHLALKSEIAAGIANTKNASQVSFAYPNPANDVLHVNLTKNSSGKAYVEIYDATGKLVVKDQKNVVESMLDINVSSLSSGNYYYRITSGGLKYTKGFSKD